MGDDPRRPRRRCGRGWHRDVAPALRPAPLAAALSLLVWPFPLLVLAYRAPVPLIAAGAFLGGASFAIFDTQWQTTMQREVPVEVLSRVSAYDWFGSLIFLPLGYAIVDPSRRSSGSMPCSSSAAPS